MNRDEALKLVQQAVPNNRNLINHMLAVEAIMRGLAVFLGQDVDTWGLAGLLHDVDYAETGEDPARHSKVGSELLADLGLPGEIVHAVLVHNDYHGIARESLMDKALYAADPLSGLIVAAALIRPEKKLAAVDLASLTKRFNEKSFARGAKREQIAACGELGLTLEQFLNIGLKSMQGIATSLGL
jgi:putative nucleotidyltransferase with HDIG domain